MLTICKPILRRNISILGYGIFSQTLIIPYMLFANDLMPVHFPKSVLIMPRRKRMLTTSG